MDRYKKALIVTFHQVDKRIGGPIASRLVINMFAELIEECSLIYPATGRIYNTLINEKVRLYPCGDLRPRWLKGVDVYRGVLHRFYSFTREFLEYYQPDLVVFDTSVVSHRIVKYVERKGIPVITIHHNVERDYYRTNNPSLLVRLPLKYFSNKAEEASLRYSALNLTFTEYDCRRLSDLYIMGTRDNKIKCLGLYGDASLEKISTHSGISHLKDRMISFLITGSLSFPQSEDSILDFVYKYVPVIKRVIPDFRITVAGSQPSPRLISVLSNDDIITLIPDPDNLMTHFRDADVYICPVDRGSGMKLRIMEALKAGLPVLSHENSCRGYEKFVEKGFMLSYNSVDSLIKGLVDLLNMKIDSTEISKMYYKEFSFQTGVNKLRAFIQTYLK